MSDTSILMSLEKSVWGDWEKTQWMEVCGNQNGERAGARWVDVIGQVLNK